MSKNKTQEDCSCTQNFKDLLRAAAPKNDLLQKGMCMGCSKIFWTNSNNDICFDCQAKTKQL